MKTYLFLAVLTALASLVQPAARSGALATGIEIGSFTGVTAKYYMNRENALQFSVGSNGPNGVAAQGAYLWHNYGVFHSDGNDLENKLPLYFGVGGLFHTTPWPYGTGAGRAGAKGVFGATYLFDEPFDLYLELSPTLYLVPEGSFQFHAALGGRFYFGAGVSKAAP